MLGICAIHVLLALPPQVYDMLGNAWEWVDGGEPAKRVLRGGSFVDYDPTVPPAEKGGKSKKSPPPPANHAITPGTRMETTQDSGSANTSFRCVSTLKVEVGADGVRRGRVVVESEGESEL